MLRGNLGIPIDASINRRRFDLSEDDDFVIEMAAEAARKSY